MKLIFLCFFVHVAYLYACNDDNKYYSEFGQDKFLNELIFKNKRSGIFFDIGAYDGIFASNTYFFEKKLDWTGICVEPLEYAYKKLICNRKCICVYGAVAASSKERDFVVINGRIDTFSGFVDTYQKRHWTKIKNILANEGGTWSIIKVKTYTFNALCSQYGINHIDYLSIDTEGSEEEIVRSIDFDRVDINVIDVENNYGDATVGKYLTSKGYIFIKRLGRDDIYIKA